MSYKEVELKDYEYVLSVIENDKEMSDDLL